MCNFSIRQKSQKIFSVTNDHQEKRNIVTLLLGSWPYSFKKGRGEGKGDRIDNTTSLSYVATVTGEVPRNREKGFQLLYNQSALRL